MAFTVLGEVKNHGVVEHVALAFGHGFESLNNSGHLLDVAHTNFFSDFLCRNPAVTAVVTELMNRDVIALVAGQCP